MLDGVYAYGPTSTLAGAVAQGVNVSIGSQRFLTLLSTDVDGYGGDSQILGDPLLTLVPVPEPNSLALFALGALGVRLAGRRNRT